MGDADDSYNFEKISSFYEKLLDGYEMVQGCRFSIGGGKNRKKYYKLCLIKLEILSLAHLTYIGF